MFHLRNNFGLKFIILLKWLWTNLSLRLQSHHGVLELFFGRQPFDSVCAILPLFFGDLSAIGNTRDPKDVLRFAAIQNSEQNRGNSARKMEHHGVNGALMSRFDKFRNHWVASEQKTIFVQNGANCAMLFCIFCNKLHTIIHWFTFFVKSRDCLDCFVWFYAFFKHDLLYPLALSLSRNNFASISKVSLSGQLCLILRYCL